MTAAPIDLAWDRVSALVDACSGVAHWMSGAEQARLAAIPSASRRAQFTAGRWLARRLAMARWGGHPQDWQLDAPEEGPPAWMNPPAGLSVFVSLSHSGDHAACALGEVPLGLDLEHLRRERDVMAMAHVICTAAEQALLQEAPTSGRQVLFHELWTLKEAWIKSRAESVSPGRLAQIALKPQATAEAGPARAWHADHLVLAVVAPAGTPMRWFGPPMQPGRFWNVSDAGAPVCPVG